MHYEGPIYRPPSEADSVLVQATVGCPHNRCTFCMVYKKGPPYKVRPTAGIRADLDEAAALRPGARTLFFPAGNTIAMKTEDLCAICEHARRAFPRLERITVYGSSQFIARKGPEDLKRLWKAGLSRIHVGLESGCDAVLEAVKKGADSALHIKAGLWAMEAGLELSLYVVLGLGGKEFTRRHVLETARTLNAISPHFIRLRTFVPKVGTPMLDDVLAGRFEMLGPHGVLEETRLLLERLDVRSYLASDHYTNYINLHGALPESKLSLLTRIDQALAQPESSFRPFFVGDQ